MKHNKISKLALLAGLLVMNTTANSFYQCVPKKSWKRIAYLTPQSKQEEFKQLLESGKYKVTIAGGGGLAETKEFTLTKISEFKACAGEKGGDANEIGSRKGKGGGGMGYNGSYESHSEGGYGDIVSYCESMAAGSNGGKCGTGCHKGEEGGGYGMYKKLSSNGGETTIKRRAGGGGGGGSYFEVADIKKIVAGGYGKSGTISSGGKGAGPDGYVIIEKWE